MIPCRMCPEQTRHVHYQGRVCPVSRNGIGHQFIATLIDGLDFGVPAVRYKGVWWAVTQKYVESVFPKIRLRLMRHPEVEELGEAQDGGCDPIQESADGDEDHYD